MALKKIIGSHLKNLPCYLSKLESLFKGDLTSCLKTAMSLVQKWYDAALLWGDGKEIIGGRLGRSGLGQG